MSYDRTAIPVHPKYFDESVEFYKEQVKVYSDLRKRAAELVDDYRKNYYAAKKELVSIEEDLDDAINKLHEVMTEEYLKDVKNGGNDDKTYLN